MSQTDLSSTLPHCCGSALLPLPRRFWATLNHSLPPGLQMGIKKALLLLALSSPLPSPSSGTKSLKRCEQDTYLTVCFSHLSLACYLPTPVPDGEGFPPLRNSGTSPVSCPELPVLLPDQNLSVQIQRL